METLLYICDKGFGLGVDCRTLDPPLPFSKVQTTLTLVDADIIVECWIYVDSDYYYYYYY